MIGVLRTDGLPSSFDRKEWDCLYALCSQLVQQSSACQIHVGHREILQWVFSSVLSSLNTLAGSIGSRMLTLKKK